MIYFTSDHHFGHENIIKYCKRPFANAQEMDIELIKQWNERVSGFDTVYHLGDFTLGDYGQARQYLKQLNGEIKILGNTWHHDKRWINDLEKKPVILRCGKPVEIVPPIVVLEFDALGSGRYPQALTLCHYPIAEWDRKHHGGWHLHGHSHGNFHASGLMLDVGVDCWDFAPVSLAVVKNEMRKLKEAK